MPLAIASPPEWFHMACTLLFMKFGRFDYHLVLLFMQVLVP
jgi:uncharacterized membrane protein YhdT